MSLPVVLAELHASITERGPGAYVLTVSDDGRPLAAQTSRAESSFSASEAMVAIEREEREQAAG